MELRFDYEQARKENPRLKVKKRGDRRSHGNRASFSPRNYGFKRPFKMEALLISCAKAKM